MLKVPEFLALMNRKSSPFDERDRHVTSGLQIVIAMHIVARMVEPLYCHRLALEDRCDPIHIAF